MKIVAMGGGTNGRNGQPYEVKPFDEEIVNLTGKKNPNFLFIGFTQAKLEDADEYYELMKKNFSNLGCNCNYLRETDLKDLILVQSKLHSADIIYVGGGNTLRLMNLLRKFKLDEIIKQKAEKGTVLCGVSAGAICWCKYGNSDSRKFTSGSKKLIKVTGLGFVDVLFCPHYNVEKLRQKDLKRMMKTTKGVALAFDNCTALKIDGNKYEVLKVKNTAKARKCYYKNGEYIKRELANFGTLQELSSKE